MSNTYYTFTIVLDLSHPSFIDHELVEKYNGKTALFESVGYKEYADCAKHCDLFNSQLAKELTQLTNIKHNLVWESNPSLKSSNPAITPVESWQNSELVKMYIVLNTQNPVTLENIQPVSKTSIYRGKRDSQFTN